MPADELGQKRAVRTPSYAAVFASGLIDPQYETPACVIGPAGKGAVKRYNVYRNNVTVSLIDALAAIFPATQQGCPGNDSLCRGRTPGAASFLGLLSGCRDSESGA